MSWFDRLHRVATAAAVGVVVVVLAGCGDDDAPETSATTTEAPASPDSTTTSTTAETTTSDGGGQSGSDTTASGTTAEQAIVDRYVGYWDARFAANSGTPNPDDAALREYATGKQLDAVIAETRANLEQGLAFRRADDPHDLQRVTVVEIDGDSAVVQECVVSDGVIVERDTGEVVNDEVATHNVRGELQRVDGVWRVSAARLVQRWEGVAGCAAADS
jgi:hypothetical protein